MFTLSDELVSIRCPDKKKCGAEFQKSVGSLKVSAELHCLTCGKRIEHDPQQFARRIQHAEKAVEDALRSISGD